ncbi:PREDICTED: uncharacterized protein LOC108692277 isoform X2 [Atta colombica]|uniref:uncharacterized protein LOC108692277 isoform X2 n=1 Tax=Atta colombica TaxID=520822 RepID=UPI00084C66F0|nr:PREDICTED: uncharacterized protein LOC108692277 isoform X2 [Atta colombica]
MAAYQRAEYDAKIHQHKVIPITAIRQTASAVQIISPGNTQRIDSIVKIPVSTLQAIGTFVKTTREQGQQIPDNIQARQERRERILALKEQKRKRKEEIQNQRLLQQQLKRTVRHHQKDPLGLNAWSNLLVGHHADGLLGHYSGLGGRRHRDHKIGQGLHKPGIHHGIHGGYLGNHPQHTYEVHENVNEDTSFSWHGLTAGFSTFTGIRPSNISIKIENKVAPKENIKNKLAQEYDDPLENKIAPRNGRVTFVQ